MWNEDSPWKTVIKLVSDTVKLAMQGSNNNNKQQDKKLQWMSSWKCEMRIVLEKQSSLKWMCCMDEDPLPNIWGVLAVFEKLSWSFHAFKTRPKIWKIFCAHPLMSHRAHGDLEIPGNWNVIPEKKLTFIPHSVKTDMPFPKKKQIFYLSDRAIFSKL